LQALLQSAQHIYDKKGRIREVQKHADAQHCLHGEHELGDVVGVEGGCLGGEAGGQVGESDVGHIVVHRHLPGGDRLNVAASLSSQVNNLTYL
jgi:hypothetical protein